MACREYRYDPKGHDNMYGTYKITVYTTQAVIPTVRDKVLEIAELSFHHS